MNTHIVLAGQSPASAETEYWAVRELDLTESPAGQGFLLHTSGNDTPRYGITDSDTWPIIQMRERAIGAAIRRWLQVPGPHRGEGITRSLPKDDLAIMEAYYRQTRGEGKCMLTPGPFAAFESAHLLEIDHTGEVVTRDGYVNVQSFAVVAVELALPIMDKTSYVAGYTELSMRTFTDPTEAAEYVTNLRAV